MVEGIWTIVQDTEIQLSYGVKLMLMGEIVTNYNFDG